MTSGMTGQMTMIPVTICTRDGYPVPGKAEIQVLVEYIVDVDASYGEDADGNRGALKVEHCFLQAYLEPSELAKLTAEEAKWALAEAEAIFEQTDKYHK